MSVLAASLALLTAFPAAARVLAPAAPVAAAPGLPLARAVLAPASLAAAPAALSASWSAALAAAPALALAAEPASSPASELLLRRYEELLARAPETASALSEPQRRALWQAAFAHPVAGLDDPKKLEKYDPTGLIGFCFGRSMAVHLLARAMGLAQDSVRMLFVTGDLRSGEKPEWRFHVAALVRGDDGGWHAIDPILGKPMGAAEWIAAVKKGWDKPNKARFYLAPPQAVVPDFRVVMDAPERETGARLIDLSFEPAGRPGFSPALGGLAWELDAAAAREHFMSASREGLAFDFTGADINGMRFDYAGYFADLLRLEPEAPAKRRGPAALEAEIEVRLGPGHRPLGLHFGMLERR